MHTIEEIADKLRVKRGAVETLIKRGKIKAVKGTNYYRITEEEYQRFLGDSLEK